MNFASTAPGWQTTMIFCEIHAAKVDEKNIIRIRRDSIAIVYFCLFKAIARGFFDVENVASSRMSNCCK